jgi:hypothetical protein
VPARLRMEERNGAEDGKERRTEVHFINHGTETERETKQREMPSSREHQTRQYWRHGYCGRGQRSEVHIMGKIDHLRASGRHHKAEWKEDRRR